MKISRYVLLPFLISIIFFIIPFFWLKPGEMDLGGDSSRLYFYDPIRYLFGQSLFGIFRSGFGEESQSYYGIPFFLLLAFFKSVLSSSTLLISGFHGMSLSIAFVSCYLIIKELLYQGSKKAIYGKGVVETASILGGLFYNLSPVPILGWGYVILTYNQVFLNPLIFFLLLRFFVTSKIKFILIAVLISFIFAPNFTYIGAPPFFAFYPLALLFLILYAKYIRNISVPVKKLVIGVILFLLLHAFHLIPQVMGLLSPGSVIYEAVFSNMAKVDRGLGYFSAIAPSINVSTSLLSMPQLTKLSPFSWVFIVFPLVLVLGFIWNKRRVYLLTGAIFLIALFFYSANITAIGLALYNELFRVPGFSMFRNFYGQWQWTYLFFYVLLLGQALAIILGRIRKWHGYMLIGFLVLLLIVTSWPFINGSLTDTTHWQSKNIKTHIEMDPQYEKVLSYIRKLSVDGKVLSLPMTDPGYQVLQGKHGGAYEGPSTITYLTNKNEFIGISEFGQFGQTFLDVALDKNYPALKNMLSLFNIKYIFYNSDPYIFGDNFPALPYQQVYKFLPSTQNDYKIFIEQLGVKKKADFGNKYHIYEIKDDEYLPHIYAAKKTLYWNNNLTDLHAPLSFYPQDKRIAFYYDPSILNNNKYIVDDIFFTAQNESQIFDFFKTQSIPKFVSPTISQELSSLIYPLIVLREKNDLGRFKIVNDAYIDRSIYFAEKRINELAKLEEIPLLKNVKTITDLGKTWIEPKLWEFSKYNKYNSWEITLVRYQRAIDRLIGELEKPNQSNYSNITNKVELKNILTKHENRIRKIIREDSSKLIEEKKYLINLIDGMFVDIFTKLNLNIPDNQYIQYKVGLLEDGRYEIYLKKDDIRNLNITLSIDGEKVYPKVSEEGEWIRFDDVIVKDKTSLPITLTVSKVVNLIEQTNWGTLEKNETEKHLTTLVTTYDFLNNTSGLVRDISEWTKNSIYTISFDYLTYDQNFLISLFEMRGTKAKKYADNTYNEKLRSKEWKKFNAAVLSKEDAQAAFLQITKDQDDIPNQDKAESVKKIEIRNLSVEKVYNPQIIFKKIVKSKETITPQITFIKINPTKYKVVVREARDPYSLVLSEKFNTKWMIFLPNKENETMTIKGAISRGIGKIFTSILNAKSIVIESESYGENLATHFNNSLNEGIHRNTFLDKSTFETFGQDPIVQKTHLPVNWYANSWYITPKDVQNKEDYELIVEMTSQKLFYGSLAISVIVLILTIIALIKSLFKNK